MGPTMNIEFPIRDMHIHRINETPSSPKKEPGKIKDKLKKINKRRK